uniref:C-type lectin domain-containing protein n=1 Tax=Panagrellus redivivus TaxID=6233 RepID=A0A7E4VUD3_PANRE
MVNNYAKFADAKRFCSETYHGELVSIYSESEYYVVAAYFIQINYGQLPVFIGLQTYSSVPYYRWQDGSAANYTHWNNQTAPFNITDDSCFGWVETQTSDGWIVVDCQAELPFICKQDPDIVVNGTSGSITSPSYPLPYQPSVTTCYYITVPKKNYHKYSNFSDAKDYCSQVADGELVSIYSKFEYDIVSSYIEQQNFEDTFPVWIGLETYIFEPHYRWQDKSLANYTHFVNGTAPSNTTGSSCFAWLKTVANDGWIVVDCQNPLPFICKRHVPHGNNVYLNGTSGTITSPKYPIPYEPAVTSNYYLTVPAGNVVDLTITSTYRANMIESSSNQVRVEFVASGSSGGRYFGWKASFNAVVPITYRGAFSSTNYPENSVNEVIEQYIRVPPYFGIIFNIWDYVSNGYATLLISTRNSSGTWNFINWDTGIEINHTVRLDGDNAKIYWWGRNYIYLKRVNITWVADP